MTRPKMLTITRDIKYYRITHLLLLATGVMALAALIGWQFNLALLKQPIPPFRPMNPMTALCFIASCLGLYLFCCQRKTFIYRFFGFVASSVPLIMGVIVSLEYYGTWSVGADRFLFKDTLSLQESSTNMVQQASVGFVFLGVALVLVGISRKKTQSFSNYVALIVFFIGLFSLMGYVYQIKEFYRVFLYAPMALHTSFCFTFMAAAILFYNAHIGFMKSLTSVHSGGVLARILIPSIIVLPVMLGYLRLYISWKYVMSQEFGVAVLVISIIIIFFLLIYYVAALLNHSDVFRKQAERRINKLNEELEKKVVVGTARLSAYKHALDASSMVAITDLQQIIIHVNDNYTAISKYSREELIGRDLAMINPEFYSQTFIDSVWAILKSGSIWKGELKIKAKDAAIYWVDATLVPILDGHQKPCQYMALCMDITQRKQSQEAQQALEQRIQAKTAELTGVFEKITDGFIMLDKDFRYTYANYRIGEMTGQDPQSLIGKNVWEVFPEAVGSATYHAFYKAMQQQQHTVNIDYYQPIDLWQENHIYPTPEGLSVFIRDISKQKKDEEKILKLNRQLAALNANLESNISERTAQLGTANRELEAFSYSVSHDLRAPLRAVSGYAKMLEEDHSEHLNDSAKRLLGVIQHNARHMGMLIDDLLTFSQLGRKEIQKSWVDMNTLTYTVVNEFSKSTIHQADIRINPLLPVPGDSSLLRQVLVNFLSNAVKYSSKLRYPLIEINSQQVNGNIVYSVKDNGTGFDMAYKDKLFGVFQRLHTQEQFEGTGVGLAIVKRIIDKHNGKVWAEAEPGKGSTFYFSLPADINKNTADD